jgi:hypothetical protein
MQRLNGKIEAVHERLTESWNLLLHSTQITRIALINWISTMLCSNWSRTKLRTQRRTTSNDGFLLNIGAVMLRIAFTNNWFNNTSILSIDPLYVILPLSRLDVKDETKICTTPNDESIWLRGEENKQNEWKYTIGRANQQQFRTEYSQTMMNETSTKPIFQTNDLPFSHCPPSSSSNSSISPFECSYSYFEQMTPPSHSGIVCDICRTKDPAGARYKCAQCRDYDVCSMCETSQYIESLGLSHTNTVTFACPYHGCTVNQLNEVKLQEHISTFHSSDQNLVNCPICEVNGNHSLFLQPKFTEHLINDHCDNHNMMTHTFLKIPNLIPHFHRRLFTPLPPFPIVQTQTPTVDTNSIEMKMSAVESGDGFGSSSWVQGELGQRTTRHEGIQCNICQVSPIM